MRYYFLLLLSLSSAVLNGQVSLTTLGSSYTQDFNTLAASGTSSTLPGGWLFLEAAGTTGNNSNTLYTAGTGSGNTGDTYSFGAASATDRAFGGLLSGSLVPTIGASFTNNTGSAITSLQISYTGEQWRLGTASRADRLDFQYSLNATALNNGTWTDVDSLDFTAPITTTPTGALNGNLSANRTAITFTITGLNIASGATFYIRWNDFNATGADDGLAVDDFSLTPAAGTTSTPPSATGTATSVLPGNSTTMSGTISAGTNPASASYTVVCDLTSVGGSATFNLPVTGTAFTSTYSVPGATAPAVYPLPCTVTDNVPRSSNFNISLTVNSAVTSNLSINDVSANETNSGTTSFNFTVALSSPAGAGGVTFNIATANGTASSPTDFTAKTLTAQSIPAGQSTYAFSVLVNGDMTFEANETFLVNVTNVTGATVTDGQGQGTILNDELAPPITAISAVQGSGISSPLDGQVVTVSGIVTALVSNGYFLQTPDASVDSDPNTSEGIFVFLNASPTVLVGQAVTTTGTVDEFRPTTDPNSRPITEITSPASTTVLSSGNPLPATVVLPPLTATGGLDQYERFEGMRVQVNGSVTVVAPTSGNVNEPNATANSNGVLYAVFPGVAMPFREAGIDVSDFPANPATACAAGSGCALPQFDSNPERLRIDTDGAGQTAINVNTGATLSNLLGVMHYGFRAYSLLPTQAPAVGGTQVSSAAASVPPSNVITIASMNVERLFDTVDDPGGDVAVTQTAFDGRLNKMSLAIRNLLRTPDVVAFSEVEKLSALQALATKINNDAVAASQPNPQYQAFLNEGNDPGGIDVGFLVKNTVTVSSVTQLGLNDTYTSPCTGNQEIINDRPPLRLRGTSNGIAFVVLVNHLRSLNGVGSTDTCTLSTEGARVRAKRAAQANFLTAEIQSELTANPAAKIVLVGDFNAFEVNDGYGDTINAILGTPAPTTQVLQATADPSYANMTNMLSLMPTAQRYSYVFDGNHQTLDHAILNPAAVSQFVGGGYVRVNSDFNEFNFRGNFSTPERYSDHDPVYVRLSTLQNVTQQLGVTRTILAYNRGTGLYQTTVTITNNSGSTITGQLQMAVTGVTDKATLMNATSATPAGGVYTNLPSSLAPGQPASVLLTFSMPASMPVNFTVNVFAPPSGI